MREGIYGCGACGSLQFGGRLGCVWCAECATECIQNIYIEIFDSASRQIPLSHRSAPLSARFVRHTTIAFTLPIVRAEQSTYAVAMRIIKTFRGSSPAQTLVIIIKPFTPASSAAHISLLFVSHTPAPVSRFTSAPRER